MGTTRKQCIVIGAGPAGLTAAYRLLRDSRDYDVLVLEESGTVGGISRTVEHHGNRMDIGGHRFFSKVDEVNRMWDELMPMQGKPSYDDLKLGRDVILSAGGPDPGSEDRVMLSRHRVSRIYYRKHFFDYPVKMNLDTVRNMGLATTFAAGMSYCGSILRKLPETSLENFYINRFGRKLYSMFFEGYTEKLWGRHPRDISAAWGAQRVKGLSVVAVIKDICSKLLPSSLRGKKKVETSLIEEFHYPKYGPGQLWGITADRIAAMGGRILYHAQVTGLRTSGGAVTAVTCMRDGHEESYPCDCVFSSMPLKDLIAGMDGVPADIAAIAAGLPYRDFVTVGLLLDRINLKNETKLKTLGNIVPDCWIYVQDTGIKLGRIQIFNNWSPYMVHDPERTVWLGLEYFCKEGDAHWTLSDEEWKTFAAGELVRMDIIGKDNTVRDAHVERVRKAYPAYFDTYAQIDALIAYLNTYGNLYCIGRNGQHRYNNMDHSMATAFEAVRLLLAGTGDKTTLWSVNTEEEYHETR